MKVDNLTQIESIGLTFDFNMADAHTHQSQSPSQARIVARLPEIFTVASIRKQHELDRAAIVAYHALARQETIIGTYRSLICYSSSIAMEIVANFLRQRNGTVMLIEPTFDNIADILKRHDVPLIPLSDDLLKTRKLEGFFEHLGMHSFDALFLTLPNNPTGTFLSQSDFISVAQYCKQHDIVMIIDTCFRLFEPGAWYDQYEILERIQTDYIVIEDTGKVWPMLDLKVGFLNSSHSIHSAIANIHSDFLLNVSPFVLLLVQEYCKDSALDSFNSVHSLVMDNRAFLREKIANTILNPAYPHSRISVEFLAIVHSVNAPTLHKILSEGGVYVLPGNHFFWDSYYLGESFIRVALARDRDVFQKAVLKMVSILNTHFSYD